MHPDHATLVELETALWREETRFDRAWMDRVLHDDFVEFGQSGRVWDRATTVDVEPAEIGAILPLRDVEVHEVADGVALLTYTVTDQFGEGRSARHTRRSSWWLRRQHGWRLRFHQGTSLPDDAT